MKVVVVTPNPADGSLAAHFLAEHGHETVTVGATADLETLDPAELGCVVLVEEALPRPDEEGESFQATLQAQPAWSDLPLVLVGGNENALSAMVQGAFPRSGNVTILQRPLHPVSLVSAVNVALRARARQLEVRDLLHERERAVQQRDEFLAMLAHELRNPLAPIRNAVYLLGTLENDDPLFVKCRAMIDKQARHITRLVDDLLDVSRLELGKIELRTQPIELDDSVAAAVESCGIAISSQGHTLNLRLAGPGLRVSADGVRLEQAICNLLINAAKFTPEGGTVEVETYRDGADAVVAVIDNGVGIQPAMLESIFDLFTQDSVTLARTKGGLGIGLTLVKRLFELHGGSVRAHSEGLGHGSRFEGRLPLAAAAPAKVPVPAAPRAANPKRVLIIEDGADARESLALLISTWQHEVLFAGSGPEGLDRARAISPDVAIIDIGLPGLDGYQVARRIRREGSAWSRHVKLIALTGYGRAADRDRAIEAGFDVHLRKPVDPEELRLLLD